MSRRQELRRQARERERLARAAHAAGEAVSVHHAFRKIALQEGDVEELRRLKTEALARMSSEEADEADRLAVETAELGCRLDEAVGALASETGLGCVELPTMRIRQGDRQTAQPANDSRPPQDRSAAATVEEHRRAVDHTRQALTDLEAGHIMLPPPWAWLPEPKTADEAAERRHNAGAVLAMRLDGVVDAQEASAWTEAWTLWSRGVAIADYLAEVNVVGQPEDSTAIHPKDWPRLSWFRRFAEPLAVPEPWVWLRGDPEPTYFEPSGS